MNDYIISRLRETSTWKGIIMLIAGILGFEASGEDIHITADQIISIGAALSGMLGISLPDKLKR
jgi:hypothetical protein